MLESIADMVIGPMGCPCSSLGHLGELKRGTLQDDPPTRAVLFRPPPPFFITLSWGAGEEGSSRLARRLICLQFTPGPGPFRTARRWSPYSPAVTESKLCGSTWPLHPAAAIICRVVIPPFPCPGNKGWDVRAQLANDLFQQASRGGAGVWPARRVVLSSRSTFG